MRTTVRLDDDLLAELKERAQQEGVSLAHLFNRTVRAGLAALKDSSATRTRRYREKTFRMGAPQVDLTKAMQLAAALDDERTLARLKAGP